MKQLAPDKFRKTDITEQDPAYLKMKLIDIKKNRFFYITKLKDSACRSLLSNKFQRWRTIPWFLLLQSDFVRFFWFVFLKISISQYQLSMIELTMLAILFLMNKRINTPITFPFSYAGFPQSLCDVQMPTMFILSPPSSIRKLAGVTLSLQTRKIYRLNLHCSFL